MDEALLRRIENAAIDPNGDIGTLLRMCKILAARVDSVPLAEWLDGELGGYSEDASLPSYRVLEQVRSLALLENPMRGSVHVPIPYSAMVQELGEEIAEKYIRHELRASVDVISSIRDTGSPGIAWPQDALIRVARHFTEWGPVQAWIELPVPVLAGNLGAVRNNVLEFALQLGKEHPELLDQVDPQISSDAVNQIFHNTITIHGDHAQFASAIAGNDATNIVSGHTELRIALQDAGASPDELQQVVETVEKASDARSALDRLRQAGGRLAELALATGVVEAIKGYFGG